MNKNFYSETFFCPKRRIRFLKSLIVMKLTSLILIVSCLGAYGSTEAQITVHVNNGKVEQVLKNITKQTGIHFIYENGLLENQRTNVDIKNESLEYSLKKVFDASDFNYVIHGGTVVIRKRTSPPMKTIQELVFKGKVSDAGGTPLAGVSISEMGSNNAVQTDEHGLFSLKVSAKSAQIGVSMIGYDSQLVNFSNQAIEITLLASSTEMQEVVVVGYGTQRKSDVSGSISSIDGEALTKAPMPNLANSLAGKITGVITAQRSGKPGFDDPTFLIRGQSTFGDNGALVLVDGVERSMSRIDPNEIASVTVLKDAASAAVYGARGANGVVLITTKRGIAGKTSLSYTGTMGIQQPTLLPKMMNALDYATYLNLARENQGESKRFSDKDIEAIRIGEIPSTNWWKETLKRSAPIKQHNLMLNGGNEEGTKYFVSLGILDQDGLYDLSFFKRYNLRLNLDNQVTKDLAVSLDIGGRHENLSQSAVGDGLFSTILNSKPTERAYVPNEIVSNGLGSNGQNVSPIGQADHSGYARTNNNVFQGTLQAKYDAPFLKGLSAKIRFSYDRFFSDAKTFTTPYTYYNYDRINNLYSEFLTGGGTSLYEGTANDGLSTLQTFVNYDSQFGDHNISALFLVEQTKYYYRNLQASRVQFESTAIDQLFAGPDLNQRNNGSANETAKRGYVGRVNYDYQGKYFLQANFRYDGSFNFPEDKRWGLFPAVSAAWNVHKENFFGESTVLTNLKLRTSYGQFGNDRIPAFQYLSGFRYGSGSIIGGNYQSGLVDTGIPNPNITWETATNTDIGLEFGLFNGVISGEVDYFYKKTEGILLPRSASVPGTFGAVLPYENIGIVENRGVEALLRFRKKMKEWNIQADVNMTHAKSKVIYMDEPADVEARIKRTGKALNQFFGLQAIGLFQTQGEIDKSPDQDGLSNLSIKPGDIKYHDLNGDGVINGQDIHNVGSSDIPNLIFGFNLNLGYKGFDLTANFQGAKNFQQYIRFNPFNLESNALEMFKDSWTPDNRNASLPTLYSGIKQNNAQSSSFWLYDATYLKLRNLEIAYTFPSNPVLKRVGVQNLRVFLGGNNLFQWSKINDFDAEAPNIDPDRNSYYYPQLKSYTFGINATF